LSSFRPHDGRMEKDNATRDGLLNSVRRLRWVANPVFSRQGTKKKEGGISKGKFNDKKRAEN